MTSEREETEQTHRLSNNAGSGNGNRQVTVTLASEDYERLFFQPSPAHGDLSERLGNPTLVGLLGFLIPFQTAVFCYLGFRGADDTSLTAISGSFYFSGGIAMNIAGILELIIGNTFPGAVFIIYGGYWIVEGYIYDPAHDLAGAYAVNGGLGALSLPYNSGDAFFNLTLVLVSLVFFIGSLKTNGPFALAIFCLIPLFALFAASDLYVGYHPTEAGIAYAAYLNKVGAGFGFVTTLCGWYLAIITVCASTGVPCPLPIFDLSTNFATKSKPAELEHAGHTSRPPNPA